MVQTYTKIPKGQRKMPNFCLLVLVYWFLLLVGQIHANKNEGRAKEEPNSDLLVEQPPGKADRGDGIEIDPVGGNDSSEFADDPVPKQIADHRGDDTQEQQVQDDGEGEERIVLSE